MLVKALVQRLLLYTNVVIQFQLDGEIIETLKRQGITIKSQQTEKGESAK